MTAPHRLEEIARRLGALPADKQDEFAAWLAGRGIDVLDLPIVALGEAGPAPLSHAQRRLWLLDQLHPGDPAYNVPRVFTLAGELDRAALAAALTDLVDRHHILRTTFAAEPGGEEPVQVVGPAAPIELDPVDLAGLPPEERVARARALADDEAARPFDLARGPLIRARLVRLGRAEHWLLITSHHIVMDEWSDEVLGAELAALYGARRRGRPAGLAPLPIQYADFARWQRRWLGEDAMARQLAYWTDRLAGGDDGRLLEPDLAPPAAPTDAAASHRFRIDARLADRLRALAARSSTTLFGALLALFHLVLARTSGRAEVRTGVPIANRHRRELEGLIGFFANTQVLTSRPRGAMRVGELLAEVRAALIGAQASQDLPFERLVEALAPDRRRGATPLFQVMFSWHRGASDRAGDLGELTVGQEAVADRRAKFDLVLHMTDGADGEGVGGELLYRAGSFSAGAMAALADRLQRLAGAVVARPDARLAELDWLAPGEREAILAAASGPDTPLPARTLHGWIAALAAASPGAPAVRGDDEVVTRGELDARAARIAGALSARGVGPDDRVGLCLSRSPELVAGLLGILKAGAAYVPLDPRTPPARLAELAADAGLSAVVTRRGDAGPFAAPAVAVDDPAALAATAPLAGVDVPPDSAAYVLYTSGSTGAPRGVVVSHRAITSYVAGVLERLALPAGASMALVSTPTADLGNTALFGALLSGGLLHVPGEDRCFDADRFAEAMRAHPADVLKITPSHLAGLLHAASPGDVLPRHTLVLGGEAAAPELLARVRRHGGCRIVNHYGPTETTVGVLTHEAGPGEEALPLGRPLARARAVVLDADMAPVPPGVLGELHVAGDCLARGYLGRPAATAERFVPDPSGRGGRIYRTGDRARLRADGAVEFAGRADDQIKLRGHRIEPGEVRAALLGIPGIADAHVALCGGAAGPRLVGYLVARGERPTDGEVRGALEARLPEPMIPSALVWLERLPLTPNGKLDRRALPGPADARPAARTAPRSALEATLVAVWREVLQRDEVGIDDNFFAVGGDSLLAFQVVARLRRSGVVVSIAQIFEHQTIASLAQVATLEASAPEGEDRARPAGEALLGPIQRELLARGLARPHHFNQSVLLAPRQPVDPGALRRALAALVDHHDALRMRFAVEDGLWRQSYAEAEEADLLEVLDHRGEADPDAALAEAAERAQRSLDLARGPLLRAVLVRRAPERGDRLLLVAHHLVVDGMSWRILLEDLAALHRDLAAGGAPSLPARTSSFQAWTAALAAHAARPDVLAEAARWRAEVAGGDGLPRAAVADPDAVNTEGSVQVAAGALTAEETAALLGRAPAAYRTRIDDLLLAALAMTLAEWTGRADALVRLEGHGREPIDDRLDLSRTVGWFTAAYPVRLPVAADLGRTIQAVKEALRAVPRRGLDHGVLRHLAGALDDPPPRLTFNYLGQLDQALGADGPLAPAPEPPGDERDPDAPRDRWLDVLALVEGGRLQVDWQHCPALHPPALVARLAARYLEHLRAIIAHCDRPRGLTPSDAPLARLDQAELDALPVPVAAIEDVLPLAPLQEGLLFHCLSAPHEGLYVTQRVIDIDAEVDLAALTAAWNQAVAAHGALRTGFAAAGLSRPVQIVWREVELPVEVIDLGHLDAGALAAARARLLDEDRRRPFDLGRPPLMRVRLVRVGPARHQLVWTDHHLLLDGWSCWRVLAEVVTRYRAMLEGAPLPVRPSSLRPYLAHLASLDPAASDAFWREQLADLLGPTLVARHLEPDPDDGGERHARQERTLSPASSARIRRFAEERGLTVNTAVQGALALAIALHTGADDVVFGVTVAGRSASFEGADELVGLFIQTLPLRARIDRGATAASWLRRLQAGCAAMREHEHAPLSRVRDLGGLGGGEALFDTLLVFENYPIDAGLGPAADDLRVGAVAAIERTSYPLALEVGPGEEILLQLDHDRRAVGSAAAGRLLDRIARLLEALASSGDARLSELDWLDDGERAALAAWNRTEADLPAESTMAAAFEAQVDRAPDAVAVVDRGRQLSYRELDARADRLAWRLVDAGVGPESIVAVGMEPSTEMIVALLAALKAGAAYLPLDPDFPAARLAHAVADARPRVVLVDDLARASAWSGDAAAWAVEPGAAPSPDPRGRPPGRARAENLAYCIYTSGSTGAPKAVAVPHAALLNFLASMAAHLAVDAADRFLALTSLSFDIAALELWLPLSRGASVVIAEREERADADRLLARLADGSATVVQATPTTWRTMRGGAAAPAPRARVLCGGEAMTADLAAQLAARAPRAFNVYGPTETTIWSSIHPLDPGLPEPAIGRPLAWTSMHVLDGALRPVPVGVTGELYIGGRGLARGYHARPGLTASRFVPDPAGGGARLYRTGDLARRRPDGALECLGRTDQQVKLRGHRIELGEIEAGMRAHPRVRQAAAAVHGQGGDAALVGYLVSEVPPGERPALEGEVAAALAEALPDVMVPRRFVHLDALPLTGNGKLDRAALLSPSAAPRGPLVAPRDPLERDLARLWRGALRRDEIGVRDDFFALGGDSVLALQVVAGARRLGLALSPRDLFDHPTIEGLAREVERARRDADAHPLPWPDLRVAPLAQGDRDRAESRELALGPAAGGAVDAAALDEAMREVERQHDALRLRRSGPPWQARVAAPSPDTRVLEERAAPATGGPGDPIAAAHRRAVGALDPADGPLAVATIVRGQPDRVLVTAHESAVDAASWPILLGDLRAAYAALAAGALPELAPPSASYRAWLAACDAAARGPAIASATDAWRESLAAARARAGRGAARRAEDAARQVEGAGRATEGAGRATEGAIARARIDAELDPASTALLGDVARRHRAEIDALILVGLADPLAAGGPRWVDLESAGRRVAPPGVDPTRLVGRCAAALPVALGGAAGALALLSSIEAQLRAPALGGLGGGALAAELGIEPDAIVHHLGEIDPADPPAAVRPPTSHAVTLTTALHRGRLRIAIDVDPAGQAGEAGALAEALLGSLRRVLRELAAAPPRAPRAHHFAHVALDDGELADLLEDLA